MRQMRIIKLIKRKGILMRWSVILSILLISSLSGCMAQNKAIVKPTVTPIHTIRITPYQKLFDIKHRALIGAFEKMDIENFTIAKHVPIENFKDIGKFCDSNKSTIETLLHFRNFDDPVTKIHYGMRDDLFNDVKRELKLNFKLLYKIETLKQRR